MARTARRYRCGDCGYESGRWLGFCPQCSTGGLELVDGRTSLPPSATRLGDAEVPGRLQCGIDEFDRVLGGGLVPGSVVLVGGEPGVGKSTLLLQAAAGFEDAGSPTLVVSAEESVEQVALRAGRIGIGPPAPRVVASTDLDDVVAAARSAGIAVLVVDSVQTIGAPDVPGTAGSVVQVREVAGRLVEFAKTTGTAVVLVGHVTKDGSLAGPKTLEHLVDVVVSLDGDPDRGMRFLRALKNRFGSVDEVGVFEMGESGLRAVPDPSAALVAAHDPEVAGTVLFPTLDGRRSVLTEVQALVVASGAPQPRRSAKGFPPARLHQVLAVLARHGGIDLSGHDVYASVVGGLRVAEPAIDLPLALALASSLVDRPVGHVAAWGEVGLTGELREVARAERRRREAERLGARSIVAPADDLRRLGDALAAVGIRS